MITKILNCFLERNLKIEMEKKRLEKLSKKRMQTHLKLVKTISPNQKK